MFLFKRFGGPGHFNINILQGPMMSVRLSRSIPVALLLAAAAACGPASEEGAAEGRQIMRAERLLMGTLFDIQIVSADREAGTAALREAFKEVARIEELLSEYSEESEISAVNREAGRQPVVVGPELYGVVSRSIGASELTGGAFDITFATCGHLWSFREPRIPDEAEIAECLPRVGFRRLRLDDDRSSIFLPGSDMRIGISGIAKGYGVDRAAEVLEEHGFGDYIVDGGGDIRLAGSKGGRPWKVGVADPRRPGELFSALTLDRGAIVTSGDYEKFFERDGIRYHHIIEPSTGRPARRSVAVTVIAPTAMEADALATGLFVVGPRRGLELVEGLEGIEALFFDPDLAVHASSGFPNLD
jgi:thiamine biosynthesis lipoprotein